MDLLPNKSFGNTIMEQSQTCCVCLKHNTALIHIWEADRNNTKWIQKLGLCVPEVLWCDEYLICKKCIEQLEIASAFRKLCLQSYIQHQQQCEKSVDFRADKALQGLIYVIKEDAYKTPTPKNEIQKPLEKPQNEEFPKDTSSHYNLKEYTGNIPLLKHLLQIQQDTIKSKPSTSQQNYANNDITDIIVIDDKNNVNFTDMIIEVNKNTKSPDEPIQHVPYAQTYCCKTCKRNFRNSLRLAKHNKNIHNLKHAWSCKYCDKNYKTHKEVQSHEDVHLNQKKYKCKSCLMLFNSQASLISHINNKPQNEWQYQCPHCSLNYQNGNVLKQHILVSHTHPGGDYICFHCNEGFSFKSSLVSHMGSEHNFKTNKCRYCNKLYDTQNEYDEHLHKEHNINIFKRKKYSCSDKSSKTYVPLKASEGHHDNCDDDTGFHISKKKLTTGLEEGADEDQQKKC